MDNVDHPKQWLQEGCRLHVVTNHTLHVVSTSVTVRSRSNGLNFKLNSIV